MRMITSAILQQTSTDLLESNAKNYEQSQNSQINYGIVVINIY